MNNKGQEITQKRILSRINMMRLKHLESKYHIIKRQLEDFDKKFMGDKPGIKHSKFQKEFGTSSLKNIKTTLKIKNMTNDIHMNKQHHTKGYDVNKRLEKRINSLKTPHWKMQYKKIHDEKKQRLRHLKSKIRTLKSKSRPLQRNTNKRTSLKSLRFPQSNITTKHDLYSKPKMDVIPHTIHKGYQTPQHPQRFQHHDFSI